MAGICPQMFLTPCDAHASASSGIVEEGVIGKTAQTSFVRYAMWAAAVLPSKTTDFADIRHSFYERTTKRAGTFSSAGPIAVSGVISMAWHGHCSKQAEQPVQRSSSTR